MTGWVTAIDARASPNESTPGQIDKVVEVTNMLVRQPKVEAWIFATQDQSLRKIFTEGKASAAPKTAPTVKDIVSYLASRGNPSFLDLDN
jgi:hypothetical protein